MSVGEGCTYKDLALGVEWEVSDVIGQEKERGTIKLKATKWPGKRSVKKVDSINSQCQMFVKGFLTPTPQTLTLEMATAMFAETLGNLQRSTLLITDTPNLILHVGITLETFFKCQTTFKTVSIQRQKSLLGRYARD
jgi:hypothetical protein